MRLYSGSDHAVEQFNDSHSPRRQRDTDQKETATDSVFIRGGFFFLCVSVSYVVRKKQGRESLRALTESQLLLLRLRHLRPSAPAVQTLLQDPAYNVGVVVVVAQHVLARREAVRVAHLLHFIQLLEVELRLLDPAPVGLRRVHGEARR